jgi:hypothetical protein
VISQKSFHQFDDLAVTDADLTSLFDKRACDRMEIGLWSLRRHGRSSTSTHFDETLVDELLVGAKHCMEVDSDRIGEISCRWEPFALRNLLSDDRTPNLRGNLLEERLTAVCVNPNEHDALLCKRNVAEERSSFD